MITIVASGFTWRRHRNPLPLLLTVVAAGVIFWSLYGAQLFGHAAGGHGNSMNDPMGGGMSGNTATAGLPGGAGVWIGLALLLIAQVWDVWLLRQLKRQNACTA